MKFGNKPLATACMNWMLLDDLGLYVETLPRFSDTESELNNQMSCEFHKQAPKWVFLTPSTSDTCADGFG